MKIQRNVGTVDRVIRIALGLVLVGVALAGALTAPAVYVVWAVAAIALVTGTVGFCPLYALFGLSTKAAVR